MSNATVLTEVAVLTEVNKFVGVFIALTGAFVAAPDGARLLFGSTVKRIGRALSSLIRKPPTSFTGKGSAPAVAMVIGGGGKIITRNGPASDSVEDRIQALQEHLNQVEDRLTETTKALKQEKSERVAAVTDLTRTFQNQVDHINHLLTEKDRQMATIDARGLLPFGIALSGVPEFLAGLPLRLGWFLVFGGFAVTIVAVMGAIQSHRSTATV